MQKLFVVLSLLLLSSVSIAQQALVSLEPDTDRPGNNYLNVDLAEPDVDLCLEACQKDPRCKAFTYVKPGVQGPKARCWLKDAVPPAKSSSCCISGVKTAGGTQSQPRAPQKMIQGEVKMSPKSGADTSETPSAGGQPTAQAQTFAGYMYSQREDPLLTSSWLLEVDGKSFGHFKICSGIGSMTEVVEQRAVNKQGQDIIKKVPGRLKWLDVTLKRGITSNMSVWQWRQQFVTGDINAVRKDFSIVLFDQAGNEIARWRFSKGWPSKVELSNSGEMSSIETVLITHEGMERVK